MVPVLPPAGGCPGQREHGESAPAPAAQHRGVTNTACPLPGGWIQPLLKALLVLAVSFGGRWPRMGLGKGSQRSSVVSGVCAPVLISIFQGEVPGV